MWKTGKQPSRVCKRNWVQKFKCCLINNGFCLANRLSIFLKVVIHIRNRNQRLWYEQKHFKPHFSYSVAICLPRPSRSMHFGDVDETNGGKTNSLRPRDLKRIDRAAANVQTGFFLNFHFKVIRRLLSLKVMLHVFSTTIFSATQLCNIVTPLLRHCFE